ncbi:MAG TPA: hypothetical protein PLJ47_04705 [Candidatus Hydrogenedentes bacterium]|nr:hypothetical protein [Candidatus Hydrogenedentota bacterium]
MLEWTKQGVAAVASVELTNGQRGRCVLLGPRENPKGAVIVLAGTGSAAETKPVQSCVDDLGPALLVEILCMQERMFGASGLPAPEFA